MSIDYFLKCLTCDDTVDLDKACVTHVHCALTYLKLVDNFLKKHQTLRFGQVHHIVSYNETCDNPEINKGKR